MNGHAHKQTLISKRTDYQFSSPDWVIYEKCSKTSNENSHLKSGLISGSCYASLKTAAAKTSLTDG